MRIIIISRALPYLGGREVIIERLIGRLKQEHSILLLTPDANLRRKGIKIVSIEQSVKQIEKEIKKFKPNVINCHTFYFFNLAYKLSKTFNVPLVFTLHGMFLKFYGEDYRSIIKNICKKSDVVIVVSDNYKKELITEFKIIGRNIFVIKNGVKQSTARIINLDILKSFFNIPDNKQLVVIPARINKIKGLEYLIKAVNNIKNSKFFFLVCSPCGRYNQEEIKLKDKLINSVNAIKRPFIDFREYSHQDLQKIFDICDICLLPSLTEGISISILEAMASGCFVIATNVGGTPEIIKNGVNGYLIKPRSARDILIALDNFNNLSFEKRIKIKETARETIKKCFSEDKMIKSYQDIFSKIIKKYENK